MKIIVGLDIGTTTEEALNTMERIAEMATVESVHLENMEIYNIRHTSLPPLLSHETPCPICGCAQGCGHEELDYSLPETRIALLKQGVSLNKIEHAYKHFRRRKLIITVKEIATNEEILRFADEIKIKRKEDIIYSNVIKCMDMEDETIS